jgi:hypothetical protein
LHEDIHAASIFRFHIEAAVKILDRTTETCAKTTSIKVIEWVDSTLPVFDGVPAGFYVITNRGNQSKPGDNYSSTIQSDLRPLIAYRQINKSYSRML